MNEQYVNDQMIGMPVDMGYSGPAPVMRGDRADLIDKIKPEIVAELLRHRLLGEVEDNGVWVKKSAYADLSLSE